MPQTRTVASAQDLQAALATATGGDVIVLAPGAYGALDLNGASYASNVTIASSVPQGASFTSIDLAGSANLAFDGVSVAGQFRATDGSAQISLTNSVVGGGAYFKESAGVTLKGNDISGSAIALVFNDVDHVRAIGNTIHDARSDLVRISGDSDDIALSYNHLLDVACRPGEHPDLIQMLARGGHTPSDVRIVGNVMYDDPATGSTAAQGVFVSDPGAGYRDILVADNLISVGSPNGIYVSGGVHNVLVQDNVMPLWTGGGGGSIRVVEKHHVSNAGTVIEHNAVRQVLDETGSRSAGIQIKDNPLWTVPTADLLANWDAYLDPSFAATPHAITMSDLIA